MAILLIDRINDESFRQLSRMAVHVFEGAAELERFFLAAGMYHAHKMSFQAAADLSGLGFDGFKKRLKEYFSTGYIVASETVEEDLQTARKISGAE
jgi:hypothetical protein